MNHKIQKSFGCFPFHGKNRERRVNLHRIPALAREAEVAWPLLRQRQPHPHAYRKPLVMQLRVRRHAEGKAVSACVCNCTARRHRLLCVTAPLLPQVPKQQHVKEYR